MKWPKLPAFDLDFTVFFYISMRGNVTGKNTQHVLAFQINCFYEGISIDLILYCIMCPTSAEFFCSSSLLYILDISIMYLGIM